MVVDEGVVRGLRCTLFGWSMREVRERQRGLSSEGEAETQLSSGEKQ